MQTTLRAGAPRGAHCRIVQLSAATPSSTRLSIRPVGASLQLRTQFPVMSPRTETIQSPAMKPWLGKSHVERLVCCSSDNGSSPPSDPAIGIEGLKSLLEKASETLGRCRFIVANTASGGILETVQDFGASPFRYSEPSPRGQYATLGTKTFECHINLEKIKTVVFAKKQKPDQYLQGEMGWMYIMRFLDVEGSMAVSVVLHQSEKGMEGNPQGWEALKREFGENVQI